jgi:hypothetical protein
MNQDLLFLLVLSLQHHHVKLSLLFWNSVAPCVPREDVLVLPGLSARNAQSGRLDRLIPTPTTRDFAVSTRFQESRWQLNREGVAPLCC